MGFDQNPQKSEERERQVQTSLRGNRPENSAQMPLQANNLNARPSIIYNPSANFPGFPKMEMEERIDEATNSINVSTHSLFKDGPTLETIMRRVADPIVEQLEQHPEK